MRIPIHFTKWSRGTVEDSTINLAERLPEAIFRAIALATLLLAFCWLTNVAVWSVLLVVIFLALLLTFMFGTPAQYSHGILFAASWIVREWAFGWPHFILASPTSTPKDGPPVKSPLIGCNGRTLSPLKPQGEVEIDGKTHDAFSEDGSFLDEGIHVTIVAIRNGALSVRVE